MTMTTKEEKNTMTDQFKNTSIPKSTSGLYSSEYSFDAPSPYLYLWSRLFQNVLSQLLTRYYTGKWNDRETGIFKSEGGVAVLGVGDLVLYDNHCSFEGFHLESKNVEQEEVFCSQIISRIVLEWNPNEPIVSLLEIAVSILKENDVLFDEQEFVDKLSNTEGGLPFAGNSLSDFFDHNPFDQSNPMDDHDDYWKFSMIRCGATEEEADEKIRVRDTSKTLREDMISALRQACLKEGIDFLSIRSPLCCSPGKVQTEDEENVQAYWINTGWTSTIDGWKTEEFIREWIEDVKTNGVPEDLKRS